MSAAKVSKRSSSKNAVASSSSAPAKKAKSRTPAAALAAAAPAPAADSPFSYRTTEMRLSVPPRFTGNLRQGVEEMLDSMVMRFIPKLEGVLLSHSNLSFVSDKGNILYDCPFAVVDVTFGALVWAPKVGQVLTGTHSLSSPSHLSLLIHKTFNVSIPLNHIPPAIYEFDRSMSSKEDDEDEVEAAMAVDGDEDADDAHEEVKEEDQQQASRKEKRKKASEGRWKNKVSGRAIGADGASVSFTVVGLTITSQILSLTGSLLDDPWNPPAPGPSQSSNYPTGYAGFSDEEEEGDEEESAHTLLPGRKHAAVPTQNTAAVSKAQKPSQQAPAKAARKRAVSVDFSSDSDDSDDGAAAAVVTKGAAAPTPKTAEDIDTSFPVLAAKGDSDGDDSNAPRPAKKAKKAGAVDMSLHRAERKKAKKDSKKSKKD